jgi:tetratricopeptide (TPR) repeat protein
MLATGSRETAQYRLAKYYLGRLRAAESAYRRGHEHSTDALALFDQEWSQIKRWRAWAEAHAADDDEIARLCEQYPQAGVDLFLMRQHPLECLEWQEAGLSAALQLNDQHAEMAHLFLLGGTYTDLGTLDRAQDFLQQALTLARQLGDRLYISRILIGLGSIFYTRDDYERARSAHEQALAISRELDARHEMGRAYNGLGNVALSQSDLTRAFDYYSRYLEIAEATGQPQTICMALRNLSTVTRKSGDERAATIYAERSVALSRTIGFQTCLAESLAELGALALTRGSLLEAENYYQQSLAISRPLGHYSNQAFVSIQLGYVFRQLGDVQASLGYFEAGLAASELIGERWYMTIALMNMADVARLLGNTDDAYQTLRKGLEVVCTFQSSAIRAKYVLEAALLWHDTGELEQTAGWLGLLQACVSQLTVEQQKLYRQLLAALETELGQEQLAAAVERGKDLDLDAEIAALLRILSNPEFSTERIQPLVAPPVSPTT